jgi:beta-galactosidase/beta-glucuronidase
MADTGIFATTAEVVRKAGFGANSTATAEAYTNDFMTQAESFINATTRFNWSDVYSTLNVDVKGLLKEAASNIAAMYVINYDNRGYYGFANAMLNVLWDRAQQCIKLLEEYKVKDFVSGA